MGVYISFVDLENYGNSSKQTATGLMRSLLSVWYNPQRLAACSATKGINSQIKAAIFSKLL